MRKLARGDYYTYLRFSPLNSLSKKRINCSLPTGSCRSSWRLNAHLFTLLVDISFLCIHKYIHVHVTSCFFEIRVSREMFFFLYIVIIYTYANFSCSHISGLSDTHGFVNSGWVKKGSYSMYCSKYPIKLKISRVLISL